LVVWVLGLLLGGCGRASHTPSRSSLKTFASVDMSSIVQSPSFDNLLPRIFQPKCVSCHAGFATLDGMIAAGVIVNRNPDSRPLYLRVAGGTMPMGGPPLTAQEVTAIYNWISLGSPSTSSTSAGAVPPGSAGGATPPAISPTFAWIQANVLTPRCVVCHR